MAKIEPSQLSYSTMSALLTALTDIEKSVSHGDVSWALRDLAVLKEKIRNIRAVSSKLIDE
jgi:hypothetical protein